MPYMRWIVTPQLLQAAGQLDALKALVEVEAERQTLQAAG